MMRNRDRLRSLVDRALGTVLAGLMALMVLNVLWQIASRFLLGRPSSYTEELARYLLIWLGLLGATFALGQGLHIALTGLVDRVASSAGPRAKTGLQRIAPAVVAGFAVSVLIGGGGQLVRLTLGLGQTSAALGLSQGWVYLVLPLSGVLTVFYCLVPEVAAPAVEAAGSATEEES